MLLLVWHKVCLCNTGHDGVKIGDRSHLDATADPRDWPPQYQKPIDTFIVPPRYPEEANRQHGQTEPPHLSVGVNECRGYCIRSSVYGCDACIAYFHRTG